MENFEIIKPSDLVLDSFNESPDVFEKDLKVILDIP
jgi:hypothetical protein